MSEKSDADLQDESSPDISEDAVWLGSRLTAAFASFAAGAITGVILERAVTPIEFAPDSIFSLALLSPIAITVGGAHYAAADSLRGPLMLLGLLAVPSIVALFVWTIRKPRPEACICLYLVATFFYFGLLHKLAAIMSV